MEVGIGTGAHQVHRTQTHRGGGPGALHEEWHQGKESQDTHRECRLFSLPRTEWKRKLEGNWAGPEPHSYTRKRVRDLFHSNVLSFLNYWWFPLFSHKSSTND